MIMCWKMTKAMGYREFYKMRIMPRNYSPYAHCRDARLKSLAYFQGFQMTQSKCCLMYHHILDSAGISDTNEVIRAGVVAEGAPYALILWRSAPGVAAIQI